MSPRVLVGLLIAVAASGTFECRSDLHCNLNGVCHQGNCQCDYAWQGVNCSSLRLLPSSLQSGYRPDQTSSWGGSVLHHEGLYHMFAAELVNSCGLTSWMTNSKIIRATSQNLEGPYIKRQDVIPVWSHNPTVQRTSDGTLLLLSAGYGISKFGSGMSPPQACVPSGCCVNGTSPCGLNSGHACNSTQPPWPKPEPDPRARKPLGVYQNFTLHASVSGNPAGPWQRLLLDTDQPTHQYTPTILAYPNGTVVILLVGGGLFRAEQWWGPYYRWSHSNKLYWGCGGEDPFLYVDKRGYWHCLYHSGPYSDLSKAGGHAFSLDGVVWSHTPEPTYPGNFIRQIQPNGSTTRMAIAKRERPQLLFDEMGNIIALSTGICLGESWELCNKNPWPGYFDQTFTHLQRINTRADVLSLKSGRLA